MARINPRLAAATVALAICPACSTEGRPSPAVTSGVGTSTTSSGDSSAAACLDGSSRSYRAELSQGSYGSGDALYQGPVTLAWRMGHGPFFEGPDGTHGDDAACGPASLGRAWELTATSSGTNTEGSTVRCEYEGRYIRTGTAVRMSLDGNCDITEAGTDGSDRAVDDATHEERTAVLRECTGPVAMVNCALSEVAYEASDG